MRESRPPGGVVWPAGGSLSSIAGVTLPVDGRWVPRLVSDITPVGDLNDGDRIAAEVMEDLADTRLDIRVILATVTKTLSRLRPGTWVASLMNRDPSTSLVVAADESEPALAHYVDRYVAGASPPDQAGPSTRANEEIERGHPRLSPLR